MDDHYTPINHTPQMGTPPTGEPTGANTGNIPYTPAQPYGATPQPQYPQSVPPYTPPQQPYGYTQQQMPPQRPPHSDKKGKGGKTVFAILLCICIVIASIGIGLTLSDDGGKVTNGSSETQQNSNNNKTDKNEIVAPSQQDTPSSLEEYKGKGAMTPEQVYDAVKDVNVGVLVFANNQMIGEGSGIIVGADENNEYTYIITAAHVISDAGVSVEVVFNDETEAEAKIVGFDTKTDVGVLKVKKTGYKAAQFGNSDKLSVGQTVYAIGNPGGTDFFGSFTGGMISAIDRPVSTSASAYDLPCIQHNAAINPGNSGGALVNAYGQVIGLNSSKITSTEYEGMGFSVPVNTVLEIYNDIVANGYVTNRPILGISYYAVSSDYTYSGIAWKNNLPYGSIVIASISERSDLTEKGVQVGDIITGVDGKSLDTTDILLEKIEGSKVGDTLTLSICRLTNSGQVASKFDVEITLIEDTGENIIPETQPVTDPFSDFFGGGFGY